MNFLFSICTSFVLLFNPFNNFAQNFSLCSTINFAVFTGTGAISNVGNSLISGDIGSNAGAISGFESAIITGAIHNVDPITEQAKLDLVTLYNQLISFPITQPSHAPVFGDNETLSSGVYSIASAGSLIGCLTLDAHGDSNALFIIRMGGALTAAAGTSIILKNSAASCNVFFVIEGAITIGAGSDLKGMLLTNAGAITLGANNLLCGRLFSITGAITLNENNISNISPCYNNTNCPIELPIELISFTSKCEKEKTVLNWSTASESNNAFFSIKRSDNGTDWSTISYLDGAGNSNSVIHYSFTNEEPDRGIAYYRLKQTDYDGIFKLTEIITNKMCKDDLPELTLHPNPVNHKISLLFKGDSDEIQDTSIYDNSGNLVYSSKIYNSEIDVKEFKNGSYFLNITTVSKNTIVHFIIL